ncbi:hypothetical protein OQA88_10350 [Cercophora sp. LCS_1]
MEWLNSIPNDGVIRYLGILNLERLLITSPKALAEVLVTKNYDFEKPESLRTLLGSILGNGLFFAEGEEHHVQRRKMMPAFAFRHTKDLYPIFWAKSREAVHAMTDQILSNSTTESAATSVVEVGSWASRATLDIIGVAGLGRDFDAIGNPNNELTRTYSALFQPTTQGRIMGVLALFLPGWFIDSIPIQRNNDIRHATRYIRSVCADLIRSKREQLAQSKNTDVDILSVAIESGTFADESLIDQMMTFLLAGHETTAASMTWAAYLLAKHTDIQLRLREEVRAHLPPTTGTETVSSVDIDRLPYLNAVCNEVLRYIAPVPVLSRDAARDTTIQGHFVPKGTRIMIAPWAVNKSTAMWGEDALEFKPERWLGEKAAGNGGASSNYAFMTFLHGPRSCIGKEFAKAEFACLLASWAGKFEMELHNEEERDEKKIEIKGGITARPSKGMYLKLRVLDGW